MSYLQTEKIRRRVFHSLSYDTALQAGDGCTLANLQQFLCKNFTLTPVQLTRLAHYLGVQL